VIPDSLKRNRLPVEVFNQTISKTPTNPGVDSGPNAEPSMSPLSKVTITHVTVQPGASQHRHAHATSEQIWIVEQGSARLLLANDASHFSREEVRARDRTPMRLEKRWSSSRR
jgi:mannose-6-phosphate isomerase-like protein (cupin superfamily)